jgi:hypothetical protein
MALELSNLMFTDQADVVPPSGMDGILNTGIANTLAGNDIILGTKETKIDIPFQETYSSIFNSGTLNTADGDDIITGTISEIKSSGNYYGIYNIGSIYTGDGNDKIRGRGFYGLVNEFTITTDNGNDIISGTGEGGGAGISSQGNINSGDGDDIITGTNISGSGYGIFNGFGTPDQIANTILDTGDGNDLIIGIAAYGIFNLSIINTGDGNDYIIGDASSNDGTGYGFYNLGIINTGDGNDIITEVSGRSILNLGTINTGNGADSIIAEGGFFEYPYGSGPIPGSVFLENGKDYLKGFGGGDFNGGNDKDALELTSGSYTVERSGTAVNFTKDSITMKTSEFEILIAGNTIYSFASLTNGQIITVA